LASKARSREVFRSSGVEGTDPAHLSSAKLAQLDPTPPDRRGHGNRPEASAGSQAQIVGPLNLDRQDQLVESHYVRIAAIGAQVCSAALSSRPVRRHWDVQILRGKRP
jgi:hypothetical protein